VGDDPSLLSAFWHSPTTHDVVSLFTLYIFFCPYLLHCTVQSFPFWRGKEKKSLGTSRVKHLAKWGLILVVQREFVLSSNFFRVLIVQ
jgi:hypothetical protein